MKNYGRWVVCREGPGGPVAGGEDGEQRITPPPNYCTDRQRPSVHNPQSPSFQSKQRSSSGGTGGQDGTCKHSMCALQDGRQEGGEASPLRLECLDDDTLALLIEYAGKLHGPRAAARFGMTCKRMRTLLDARRVIAGRTRCLRQTPKAPLTNFGGVDQLKTLENLDAFESWTESRLNYDNRIPFQFASVELNDSTREMVDSAKGFLNRHRNVRVRLDSHCGTAAPDDVAAAFSHVRGLAMLSSICESDDDQESLSIDRSRVLVFAWGKQISERVARLDGHRFSELAQEGRGWVEVSFLLLPSGEDEEPISLPPRPQYYNDVCSLVIN